MTAIEDTTILEVSTPHLDDVVRLEDRYGRPERDALSVADRSTTLDRVHTPKARPEHGYDSSTM